MKKTIALKSLENTNILIEYEVIKSKRRTYSISVSENGSVLIRVPLYTSDRNVEKILQEKQEWIVKNSAAQKLRFSQKPPAKYTEEQRLSLEKRYREAARNYIPKRVSYYTSSYPEILRKSYYRISIRDQKTRWGSCSSKGNLNFNWRLMLAPPAVLDYVVVHELCHLMYMNHSTEFWQCVASILPNYKEYREWLKEHGNELTLS